MPDTIPLPRLALKLKELTGTPGPTYRKLYALALDGQIPVEMLNGRIHVRKADLPEIAISLGLTIPADRVPA